MIEQEFWSMVEEVHRAAAGDMLRKCSLLQSRLAGLPPAEVSSFRHHFDRAMDLAFDYGLWGAAYVINGGCGDDTFTDFRASLISRGEAGYRRALADPDSLASAGIDLESWFYEGFQGVHNTVLQAQEQPARGWKAVLLAPVAHRARLPERHAPHPSEPTGRRWSDAELPRLYPRLWARFGSR